MTSRKQKGTGKLPLLVIEDEPAVMAFIRAALERHGYSVVQATSGVEGLDLLKNGCFRGIISDMRTPGGITGADVHAWVARHEPALISKILFTTGDLANEETARILKGTGIPYLEKPFRVGQLIAMVSTIVGAPSEAMA
jgi:CheY-like chemotaxis protein